MMIFELLAQTPPPSGLISGEVVVAIIGAIFSGGALWIGKILGERKAAPTRLVKPVPTVPVQRVPSAVTFHQHEALDRRVGRLEEEVKQLARDQAEQFKDILEAGQERERRLADKMDSQTRELHGRLDDQFGPRPQRRKTPN